MICEHQDEALWQAAFQKILEIYQGAPMDAMHGCKNHGVFSFERPQMWRYVTRVQGSDASTLGCLSLVTWNLLVNFGHLLVNRLGTQQYPTDQTVYAIKDELFFATPDLACTSTKAPKLKRSHFSDGLNRWCWTGDALRIIIAGRPEGGNIKRSTGGNVDTGGSGKHPQTFPHCWSIDFKYWARR